MYSRASFGSYYPVESIIHKLNPLVKLINFLIALFVIIYSNSLTIVLFLLIFVILMALLSLVPFRYYFNTFWFLRYIYIVIAFLVAASNKSIDMYFVYVSKLIIFFEYLNILAFTTSPSESIYAIEKFLSLPNFLYLNVTPLAYKINSILRYYPLYMSVKYKTITSSVSRGIEYGGLNFLNRIKLHSNIRRLTKVKNKEILNESKLRLFDIKKSRTNYRTNKVGFNDIFIILFHLLVLYSCFVAGGLL